MHWFIKEHGSLKNNAPVHKKRKKKSWIELSMHRFMKVMHRFKFSRKMLCRFKNALYRYKIVCGFWKKIFEPVQVDRCISAKKSMHRFKSVMYWFKVVMHRFKENPKKHVALQEFM
jgi:hypothetical protein